jgi:hypothetical protein
MSIRKQPDMTLEEAKAFANDWIDSWNTHDIERIIAHYADSLVFKSPLIVERYNDPAGTIVSRDKLREYFLIGLTRNPSLTFKLEQILMGVDGITLYYQNARGGETAEYFEFDTSGKVSRCTSCYSVD